MATDVFQVSEASFEVTAPARRGGRIKRTYRCRHCARIFKRSEHCARHERVHTQEKPFPCAFCDRRYARKDLVKRHERTLHAEEYKKAHPEEFGGEVSSGSEKDVSSRGPTQSKRRNPIPPLTPPTDIVVAEEGVIPDLGHIIGAEPIVDHTVHTPLGFSPPSSSSEGELPILHNNPGDHLAGLDSMSIGLGFSPTQMTSMNTPYAFEMPVESMLEPPSKRRRIDIDPLLVDHTNSHIASVHQPMAMPSLGSPPDDAIDPFLEHARFPWAVQSRHSIGPDSAFRQPDLSAEINMIFDLESLLLPQEGDRIHPNNEPRVHQEKCSKLPDFQFDEETHLKLCEDAKSRMPLGELSDALLPTINDLDRFFSGYLESFHRHFPIIHLPSLDLRETPSPLVFAMCSIGAQYRLARQKAKNLFALAGTMSSFALRGGLPIAGGAPKPVAIWIMQTRVLLSLCGMFSGKTNVVLRTVENLGLFAIDFRLRKSLLSNTPSANLEWEEWISRESSKRLLCGMFIISNLISSTFGITPGFSHTDDLQFEVLDEERLWNASSAQEWRELKGSQAAIEHPTVREVMTRMIFEEDHTLNNQPCEISSLTMLLITHAVNIHMGSIREVVEMSSAPVQSALLDSALSALDRCQDIVTRTRGRDDHTVPWTETEGPLMFNCQGVILMAYVRLFLDMSALNRLTLLNDNPDDIAFAAAYFAEAPMQRKPSLTKAVGKAHARLLGTVKIGHLLLRKTAALSWSLEHAVAGWVATLLVTKWIHTLETESLVDPPDVEETEILDGFKQLLSEGASEYNGSSIAAAVAHFCSTTLNDVWVWGVTPRMANVLQQLAVAYEERHQSLQLAPIAYNAD